MRDYFIQGSYLAASVLFILGLRGLSSPATARHGMRLAAIGMVLAIATMTEKYDRARVLKAVLTDPQEHTYKGKTYYTSKTSRWRSALYPVNERTIVVGTVPAIRRRLARPIQKAVTDRSSIAVG